MNRNQYTLLAMGAVILTLAFALFISFSLATAQIITIEAALITSHLTVLIIIGSAMGWGIYWATNRIMAKIVNLEKKLQDTKSHAAGRSETSLQEITTQAVEKLETSLQNTQQLTPKPDIEIRIGEQARALRSEESPTSLLAFPCSVEGRKKSHPGDSAKYAPHVNASIALENRHPKAGRFPFAILRVSTSPLPYESKFRYQSVAKPDNAQRSIAGRQTPTGEAYHFTVPFADDLIIYQFPVLVGELLLQWDSTTPEEELPQQFTLDYDIHTLDGVSHCEINASIAWK